MSIFHFLVFTKRKLRYFIFIALMWNVFQWWIIKNNYIFYKLNWNSGNAPSYIRWSFNILERCLGTAAVYPAGQAWFRFAHGWTYALIAVFWLMVWYVLACALDAFQEFVRLK